MTDTPLTHTSLPHGSLHHSSGAPSPTHLSTACITRSEQEQYLCAEIRQSIERGYRTSAVQCIQVAPQAVVLTHSSHEDLCSLPLFFSAQCLPNAEEVHADSISSWARAVLNILVNSFGDTPAPWTLHVFDITSIDTGKQYARAQRIEESIMGLLKQTRRSYLRVLDQAPSPLTSVVQVVLVEPTRGFVSIAHEAVRATYKAALSPKRAGYHPIADDKRPPSRAFKKLREALEVFALAPQRGQTAVDLGACPGGWTHVLRELGLSVTAIDRSPLSETLMRDQMVSWSAGNALTWQPATPVDWLVCDVITSPENTAQLLERWISKAFCNNFCVTVKFKGAPAIDTLLSLAAFLRASTTWFEGRQLTHNKNELTLVGRL